MAAASLLALPGIASAIGIGVIGGDPPGLVTTDLGDVQATSSSCDSSGDCTFVFNNNTGGIITSLTFSADIATGLTMTQVDSTFSCTQDVVGYFLGCNVGYDSTTGLLTYNFAGVLPPQAAETCPTGNCAPDQRGIPPDTVITDPEFHIDLTGWVATATVPDSNMMVFPGGKLPIFTDSFTATPEPSALAFLGIAFLLIVGGAQLRRRKLTASRRSA